MKKHKYFYPNNRFYSDAEEFSPHNFEPKVEMLSGIPKVLISKLAHNKMWHFVDLAGEEVSWLGTAIQQGCNFLIQDVFLLKQEVSGAQTTITEDGLAEFGQEILKQPEGVDIYNSIRFWGHSHVCMGTSPSPQDDSQMDIFENSGHPFFIRGILNKSGRIEFTIYFYPSRLKVIDPEWKVYDPIDKSIRVNIEKEFDTKVTKQTFPIISTVYDRGKDFYFNRHKGIRKAKQYGFIKTNRNIQTRKF